MSSRRLLACAVLGVLAACGGGGGSGGGGGGNPLPAAYQGTWRSPCVNKGDGTSSISQVVVGATTFAYAEARYTTATNCTGDDTSSAESGSLSNVGTVTANLGATQVTALKVDATGSSAGATTMYLLFYVDTTVNPNRQYQGLNDVAHDGSTPGTRPVALNGSRYSLKVDPVLNPLPAEYQGTWRSPCVNDGGGTSHIEQVVIGPTTFSWARTDYTTATNCTGSSTSDSGSGTLNNAGTVSIPPFTALMVDATQSGHLTEYLLFYADTINSPNRLYSGITDAAHNGSMPATRPVDLDISSSYVKQ